MAKVAEQLVGASAALAGLILVFLGVVLTAWDSYDTTAKPAVRSKYWNRALIAFGGLLSAIVSGVLGFVALGTDNTTSSYWGLSFLAVSCGLMLTVAVLALIDIRQG